MTTIGDMAASTNDALTPRPYEPAWRRPIAGIFRRTAHVAVRWCVRLDIHPNTVSYSSIVASAAAGLCFWQAGSVQNLSGWFASRAAELWEVEPPYSRVYLSGITRDGRSVYGTSSVSLLSRAFVAWLPE